MSAQPWPSEIRLDPQKTILTVHFDDGAHFALAAEYLRVESPSAEVQGHGGEDKRIVTGKENIRIQDLQPVGNYAVRIVFDDGHDSGLFTWDYLYRLGREHDAIWAAYKQARGA